MRFTLLLPLAVALAFVGAGCVRQPARPPTAQNVPAAPVTEPAAETPAVSAEPVAAIPAPAATDKGALTVTVLDEETKKPVPAASVIFSRAGENRDWQEIPQALWTDNDGKVVTRRNPKLGTNNELYVWARYYEPSAVLTSVSADEPANLEFLLKRSPLTSEEAARGVTLHPLEAMTTTPYADDAARVTGRIVDKTTGAGVPDLGIVSKGGGNGAKTGADGRFSLPLNSAGRHWLFIVPRSDRKYPEDLYYYDIVLPYRMSVEVTIPVTVTWK